MHKHNLTHAEWFMPCSAIHAHKIAAPPSPRNTGMPEQAVPENPLPIINAHTLFAKSSGCMLFCHAEVHRP
jgi:hypothetical protein